MPYVIEPAAGLTRSLMAFLVDAYDVDEAPNTKGGVDKRTVLRLDPRLAPVKAAVLPLSKKPELQSIAHDLAADLRQHEWMIDYDEAGAIGRRYRREDEIGTPLCITVDFDTIDDQAVTIRERDTMQQERVALDKVADYVAARKLVREAANTYGPMFLRFTRDSVPVIYDEDQAFEIGRAIKLRDGKDVALIAVGDTVRLAIEAAEALHREGIEARVLDMHTIKPLDTQAVNACIEDIGRIVTVEDHNILNGLGSAVCECVAEAGKGRVRRIGVQDCFGQSAPYERLLAMNGITVENIAAQAKSLLQ